MSVKGKLTYIGSFPPPYGGVTVKNALLYKHLSSRLIIDQIDLSSVKKLELKSLCCLARALISRKGSIVLGVSADWRYRLTNFLYRFNRKKMNRSFLVVMGGKVPGNKSYIEKMNGFKQVYVETQSMRIAFEELGALNVSVYPNCRERPAVPVKIKPSVGRLSSVFFSLISPDKGVELILNASDMVPDVDFHLYGRIEGGYEACFTDELAKRKNVWYHGVFDSVEGDVVSELNKYDIHLFPTRWANEGVPGVLVETKMAAVPSIVSDICYNAELVRDGIEGIVLRENTADNLVEAISLLDGDRERLDAMKASALESAERFYLDNYIDWLISDLTEEPGKETA